MKAMSTVTALVLICLAAIAAQAKAQTPTKKVGVQVYCKNSANDLVGPQICTALRDRIASSPRYFPDSEGGPRFALHVVTTGSANDTAAAVAITVEGGKVGPTLVDLWSVSIGADRVANAVDTMFASFDADVLEIAGPQPNN